MPTIKRDAIAPLHESEKERVTGRGRRLRYTAVSESATLDEVLARALASPIDPIEWTEADELAAAIRPESSGEQAIRH